MKGPFWLLLLVLPSQQGTSAGTVGEFYTSSRTLAAATPQIELNFPELISSLENGHQLDKQPFIGAGWYPLEVPTINGPKIRSEFIRTVLKQLIATLKKFGTEQFLINDLVEQSSRILKNRGYPGWIPTFLSNPGADSVARIQINSIVRQLITCLRNAGSKIKLYQYLAVVQHLKEGLKNHGFTESTIHDIVEGFLQSLRNHGLSIDYYVCQTEDQDLHCWQAVMVQNGIGYIDLHSVVQLVDILMNALKEESEVIEYFGGSTEVLGLLYILHNPYYTGGCIRQVEVKKIIDALAKIESGIIAGKISVHQKQFSYIKDVFQNALQPPDYPSEEPIYPGEFGFVNTDKLPTLISMLNQAEMQGYYESKIFGGPELIDEYVTVLQEIIDKDGNLSAVEDPVDTIRRLIDVLYTSIQPDSEAKEFAQEDKLILGIMFSLARGIYIGTPGYVIPNRLREFTNLLKRAKIAGGNASELFHGPHHIDEIITTIGDVAHRGGDMVNTVGLADMINIVNGAQGLENAMKADAEVKKELGGEKLIVELEEDIKKSLIPIPTFSLPNLLPLPFTPYPGKFGFVETDKLPELIVMIKSAKSQGFLGKKDDKKGMEDIDQEIRVLEKLIKSDGTLSAFMEPDVIIGKLISFLHAAIQPDSGATELIDQDKLIMGIIFTLARGIHFGTPGYVNSLKLDAFIELLKRAKSAGGSSSELFEGPDRIDQIIATTKKIVNKGGEMVDTIGRSDFDNIIISSKGLEEARDADDEVKEVLGGEEFISKLEEALKNALIDFENLVPTPPNLEVTPYPGTIGFVDISDLEELIIMLNRATSAGEFVTYIFGGSSKIEEYITTLQKIIDAGGNLEAIDKYEEFIKYLIEILIKAVQPDSGAKEFAERDKLILGIIFSLERGIYQGTPGYINPYQLYEFIDLLKHAKHAGGTASELFGGPGRIEEIIATVMSIIDKGGEMVGTIGLNDLVNIILCYEGLGNGRDYDEETKGILGGVKLITLLMEAIHNASLPRTPWPTITAGTGYVQQFKIEELEQFIKAALDLEKEMWMIGGKSQVHELEKVINKSLCKGNNQTVFFTQMEIIVILNYLKQLLYSGNVTEPGEVEKIITIINALSYASHPAATQTRYIINKLIDGRDIFVPVDPDFPISDSTEYNLVITGKSKLYFTPVNGPPGEKIDFIIEVSSTGQILFIRKHKPIPDGAGYIELSILQAFVSVLENMLNPDPIITENTEEEIIAELLKSSRSAPVKEDYNAVVFGQKEITIFINFLERLLFKGYNTIIQVQIPDLLIAFQKAQSPGAYQVTYVIQKLPDGRDIFVPDDPPSSLAVRHYVFKIREDFTLRFVAVDHPEHSNGIKFIIESQGDGRLLLIRVKKPIPDGAGYVESSKVREFIAILKTVSESGVNISTIKEDISEILEMIKVLDSAPIKEEYDAAVFGRKEVTIFANFAQRLIYSEFQTDNFGDMVNILLAFQSAQYPDSDETRYVIQKVDGGRDAFVEADQHTPLPANLQFFLRLQPDYTLRFVYVEEDSHNSAKIPFTIESEGFGTMRLLRVVSPIPDAAGYVKVHDLFTFISLLESILNSGVNHIITNEVMAQITEMIKIIESSKLVDQYYAAVFGEKEITVFSAFLDWILHSGYHVTAEAIFPIKQAFEQAQYPDAASTTYVIQKQPDGREFFVPSNSVTFPPVSEQRYYILKIQPDYTLRFVLVDAPQSSLGIKFTIEAGEFGSMVLIRLKVPIPAGAGLVDEAKVYLFQNILQEILIAGGHVTEVLGGEYLIHQLLRIVKNAKIDDYYAAAHFDQTKIIILVNMLMHLHLFSVGNSEAQEMITEILNDFEKAFNPSIPEIEFIIEHSFHSKGIFQPVNPDNKVIDNIRYVLRPQLDLTLLFVPINGPPDAPMFNFTIEVQENGEILLILKPIPISGQSGLVEHSYLEALLEILQEAENSSDSVSDVFGGKAQIHELINVVTSLTYSVEYGAGLMGQLELLIFVNLLKHSIYAGIDFGEWSKINHIINALMYAQDPAAARVLFTIKTLPDGREAFVTGQPESEGPKYILQIKDDFTIVFVRDNGPSTGGISFTIQGQADGTVILIRKKMGIPAGAGLVDEIKVHLFEKILRELLFAGVNELDVVGWETQVRQLILLLTTAIIDDNYGAAFFDQTKLIILINTLEHLRAHAGGSSDGLLLINEILKDFQNAVNRAVPEPRFFIEHISNGIGIFKLINPKDTVSGKTLYVLRTQEDLSLQFVPATGSPDGTKFNFAIEVRENGELLLFLVAIEIPGHSGYVKLPIIDALLEILHLAQNHNDSVSDIFGGKHQIYEFIKVVNSLKYSVEYGAGFMEQETLIIFINLLKHVLHSGVDLGVWTKINDILKDLIDAQDPAAASYIYTIRNLEDGREAFVKTDPESDGPKFLLQVQQDYSLQFVRQKGSSFGGGIMFIVESHEDGTVLLIRQKMRIPVGAGLVDELKVDLFENILREILIEGASEVTGGKSQIHQYIYILMSAKIDDHYGAAFFDPTKLTILINILQRLLVNSVDSIEGKKVLNEIISDFEKAVNRDIPEPKYIIEQSSNGIGIFRLVDPSETVSVIGKTQYVLRSQQDLTLLFFPLNGSPNVTGLNFIIKIEDNGEILLILKTLPIPANSGYVEFSKLGALREIFHQAHSSPDIVAEIFGGKQQINELINALNSLPYSVEYGAAWLGQEELIIFVNLLKHSYYSGIHFGEVSVFSGVLTALEYAQDPAAASYRYIVKKLEDGREVFNAVTTETKGTQYILKVQKDFSLTFVRANGTLIGGGVNFTIEAQNNGRLFLIRQKFKIPGGFGLIDTAKLSDIIDILKQAMLQDVLRHFGGRAQFYNFTKILRNAPIADEYDAFYLDQVVITVILQIIENARRPERMARMHLVDDRKMVECQEALKYALNPESRNTRYVIEVQSNRKLFLPIDPEFPPTGKTQYILRTLKGRAALFFPVDENKKPRGMKFNIVYENGRVLLVRYNTLLTDMDQTYLLTMDPLDGKEYFEFVNKIAFNTLYYVLENGPNGSRMQPMIDDELAGDPIWYTVDRGPNNDHKRLVAVTPHNEELDSIEAKSVEQGDGTFIYEPLHTYKLKHINTLYLLETRSGTWYFVPVTMINRERPGQRYIVISKYDGTRTLEPLEEDEDESDEWVMPFDENDLVNNRQERPPGLPLPKFPSIVGLPDYSFLRKGNSEESSSGNPQPDSPAIAPVTARSSFGIQRERSGLKERKPLAFRAGDNDIVGSIISGIAGDRPSSHQSVSAGESGTTVGSLLSGIAGDRPSSHQSVSDWGIPGGSLPPYLLPHPPSDSWDKLTGSSPSYPLPHPTSNIWAKLTGNPSSYQLPHLTSDVWGKLTGNSPSYQLPHLTSDILDQLAGYSPSYQLPHPTSEVLDQLAGYSPSYQVPQLSSDIWAKLTGNSPSYQLPHLTSDILDQLAGSSPIYHINQSPQLPSDIWHKLTGSSPSYQVPQLSSDIWHKLTGSSPSYQVPHLSSDIWHKLTGSSPSYQVPQLSSDIWGKLIGSLPSDKLNLSDTDDNDNFETIIDDIAGNSEAVRPASHHPSAAGNNGLVGSAISDIVSSALKNNQSPHEPGIDWGFIGRSLPNHPPLYSPSVG